MIKISLPVQNNVEIICGDIRVSCSIDFLEQYPATSIEGRIVLEKFKTQLDMLSGKFAHEITRKVKEGLSELIGGQ